MEHLAQLIADYGIYAVFALCTVEGDITLLMSGAMAHSEYDLQALIYTLALHRWLRFRLGDAYDYARDFGGVRYLFCRGLDAGNDDARGIHAWTPPVALVNALDVLFAGGSMEARA